MDADDETRALEALLHWYVAMGADASIAETPHDRFQSVERSPPARSEPPKPVAPSSLTARQGPGRPGTNLASPAPAETLIREAQALAAGAATLDDLRDRLADLPGCGLAVTATRMILAGGTPGARIMLIGAAPEEDDERQGNAFAGAHGRLLDAMLQAIGLARADVYLANLVPWRPPGARAPTPLELALCLPFVHRHIALADPAILLCLGERAAQPLLATSDLMSRLRGRWLSYEGDGKTVRTLVTFAPDYLLRQPLQKRRAWADLRMLQADLPPSELPPRA